MSSLVIECHVIVVNIVKTIADSEPFGISLINHEYILYSYIHCLKMSGLL